MLIFYRNCLLYRNIPLLIAVGILLLAAPSTWSAPQVQYSQACNDCHGMPPLDSAYRNVTTGAFKGNHQRHATSAVSTCSRCHPGSLSFGYSHMTSIVLISANINSSPAVGKYKVGGNQLTFHNLTSYPVLGSCSTVNCHFETDTPQWGSANYSSSSDCSGCHSVPGPSSSHVKHDRYYSWGTNGCTKCHVDYKTGLIFSHATSAGQRGISVTLSEGSYSGNGLNYLPSQSGARVFGSCTNLYCHSPGTKNSSYAAPNTVPQWGTSLTCTGCHNADVASGSSITSPAGGYGHAKHVNSTISTSFGCVRCHAATAFNNISISSKADHVDQFVTIRFNNSTTAVSGSYNSNSASGASYQKTPGTAPGSCRNVYCHSYGSSAVAPFSVMSTPTWGAPIPANCTACHGGDNTSPSSRQMATGRHTRHIGGASDYSLGCAECHKDTVSGNTTIGTISNHINYRINVGFNPTWGGIYSADGHKPGATGGNCTNVYCHSDGKATSPTYVTQSWSGTLTCTGCHGDAVSNTLSGKHQNHVNNATVIGTNYGCVDCHSFTVSDNSTISDKSRHVNKLRDYSGVRAGRTYAAGVCSDVYCHSNGKGTYKSMASTAWTSGSTLDCNGCHGSETTPAFASIAGEPNYASGAAGSTGANSHQNHVSVAGDCVKCHRTTTTTGTSIITGATFHTDRKMDVRFSKVNGFTNFSGIYGADKRCSGTYCHSASTPQWGANGTINCTSCHKANNQLPGQHIKHWAGATVATSYTTAPGNIGTPTEYRFTCSSCHGFNLSHHVSGPATATAAAEIYFGYSSGNRRGSYSYGGVTIADGSFNWTNGSCTNTYCHSNGNGGPPTTTSFDWANGSLGCTGCHDYTTIATGNHAKHVGVPYHLGCEKCHYVTTIGGAISDKTRHVNKVKDVVWDSLNPSSSPYVNATTTCGNIYCHSNGSSAVPPYGAPLNATFTWSVLGAVGCTGCHGDAATAGKLLSTGKHQLHVNNQAILGVNFGCVDCHVKTVSNNTTISDYSKHVNGYKDYSGARAGGTGSFISNVCTNIYCHSSGKRGVAGVTEPANPNWVSGGALDCKGCHGLASSTAGEPNYTSGAAGSAGANSHAKHVAGPSDCVKCHFKTTTTGTTIASGSTKHIERNIDVNFSRVSSFTTYSGVYNPGARTCSNTYCHGGTSTSPAWGGTTTCNSCHRSTPGTNSLQGAHAYHIISSASNYSYTQAASNASSASAYNFTCASCHGNSVSNHASGPAASGSDATIYFGFSTAGRGSSATSAYTRTGTGHTDTQGYKWLDGGNGNCNKTYCHSSGRGVDGTYATLNWSTGSGSLACTGCHGNAASNTLSSTHQDHVSAATYGFNCRKCHVATTTNGSSIVDKSKHVNELINIAYSNTTTAVGGTYNGTASPMAKTPGSAFGTCTNTYCHSLGTSTTPAAPNVVPTWGSTLSADCSGCHGNDSSATYKMGTVGSAAHARHVQTYSYACIKCHNTTVSNNRTISSYANHVNQQVNVAFFSNTTTALSGTYNGSASPMSKLPGSAVGACGNTYCHSNGTSVSTGTIPVNTSVSWGTAGPLPCTSCHGAGGTTGAPYYSHLAEWPATATGATWTNASNALLGHGMFASYAGTAQGTLILTNYGYTTAQVADTDTITGITVVVEGWAVSGTTPGNQLNVQLTQNGTAGVGTAKTISLPGTTSAANAEVYSTTTVTDLWGTTWTPAQIRATTFGVILKDNDTTSSQLNVDMVKVIVHTSRAPKMNNHSSALAHRVATCNICHTSVTYSAGVYTPDPTKHVNRSYNIQASMGYTFAVNGGTCSTPGNGCHGPTSGKWGGTLGCVDCHKVAITRTKGRAGTTLAAVVSEFGLAWGHKKSGRNSVTDDDCIVCHLEGDGTSHKASAYHQDGNIDLRDPDGAGETPITNISGAAWTFQRYSTSFAAGTRTTTGHTANTIDNIITQKFCLKCHDSNGATNTTSRSNNGGTGSASMPFGGVSLGATYTAANNAIGTQGLIDVATQFATTNSSRHPVLGPRTRDFPYSTRLAAPYNNIGTARNSNGTTGHATASSVVIYCDDCHNVSTGSPKTLRTITAHGNSETLRGTVYTTTPTLCTTCHTGYTVSGTHSSGSAWGATGSNHNAAQNCHYCHGSNTTTTAPSRPVRAQDYHGNNALVGGGLWPTVNSRPYAFIRGWTGSAYHRPYRSSEFTSGSATCAAGTCPGGGSIGDGSTRTYSAGGTY